MGEPKFFSFPLISAHFRSFPVILPRWRSPRNDRRRMGLSGLGAIFVIRYRVAPVAWLDLVRVLRQAQDVGRDLFIVSLSSFAYCHPEQREARG